MLWDFIWVASKRNPAVRRRGKLFGGRLKASSLPALWRWLSGISVSRVPDAFGGGMSKPTFYPFVKCGR
jgi:hypothetical protein